VLSTYNGCSDVLSTYNGYSCGPKTLTTDKQWLLNDAIKLARWQHHAAERDASLAVRHIVSVCVYVSCVSIVQYFRAVSSISSRKTEVNNVMLHCDITGTGSHTVLLLPGALGTCIQQRYTSYADYAVHQLLHLLLQNYRLYHVVISKLLVIYLPQQCYSFLPRDTMHKRGLYII